MLKIVYVQVRIENTKTNNGVFSHICSVLFHQENYLDLINGPSDHGACSSYACMKRMSTFLAIVARNQKFLCFFTATPPQHFLFKMLQADENYAVRIGIDYLNTNRLDVFVNKNYLLPTNGVRNAQVSCWMLMKLQRQT